MNYGGSGRMSPAAIKRAEKDLHAVELRGSGMTFDDVAKELGVANRSVAYRMVSRGLTRWTQPIEKVRADELDRIERLIALLWPRIDRDEPDLRAAEVLLRVLDFRAKICGLFAPKKELRLQAHATSVPASAEPAVASDDADDVVVELTSAANDWREISDELVDHAVAHYTKLASGPFHVPDKPQPRSPGDDARDDDRPDVANDPVPVREQVHPPTTAPEPVSASHGRRPH